MEAQSLSYFPKVHRASKWQSQNLDPGLSVHKCPFHHIHCIPQVEPPVGSGHSHQGLPEGNNLTEPGQQLLLNSQQREQGAGILLALFIHFIF